MLGVKLSLLHKDEIEQKKEDSVKPARQGPPKRVGSLPAPPRTPSGSPDMTFRQRFEAKYHPAINSSNTKAGGHLITIVPASKMRYVTETLSTRSSKYLLPS